MSKRLYRFSEEQAKLVWHDKHIQKLKLKLNEEAVQPERSARVSNY